LVVPLSTEQLEELWAAARLRVAGKEERPKLEFPTLSPLSREDRSRADFGSWREIQNGAELFRLVFIPGEWVGPGDEIPVCPDCGTPFVKGEKLFDNLQRCYAGCWKSHDPDPDARHVIPQGQVPPEYEWQRERRERDYQRRRQEAAARPEPKALAERKPRQLSAWSDEPSAEPTAEEKPEPKIAAEAAEPDTAGGLADFYDHQPKRRRRGWRGWHW
jgi:hypothetical protein